MIYIDVTYRHMYVLLLQIYGHSPIKISQRHITEKNDTGSLQTDLRKWKRDRDDEPCKGSTSPLHSSKNSSKKISENVKSERAAPDFQKSRTPRASTIISTNSQI